MVKNGYTLVEMLTVLLIISFILGISAVIYNGYAKHLENDAKLTNLSENLFFLLVDARRRGFFGDNIICVKYENRTFSYFIDNNVDRTPDDGIIFNSVTIPDDIKITINDKDLSNLNDLYTFEGLFVQYKRDENGIPYFSNKYRNLKIELSIDKNKKIVQLDNSYPEIQE